MFEDMTFVLNKCFWKTRIYLIIWYKNWKNSFIIKEIEILSLNNTKLPYWWIFPPMTQLYSQLEDPDLVQTEKSVKPSIIKEICEASVKTICNAPLIIIGFILAASYPGTSLSTWTTIMCITDLIYVLIQWYIALSETTLFVTYGESRLDAKNYIYKLKKVGDLILVICVVVVQLGIWFWGFVVLANCGTEKDLARPLYIYMIVVICFMGFGLVVALCLIALGSCFMYGIYYLANRK